MSERAQSLANQIKAFNEAVLAFVDNCPEKAWQQVCKEEDWTVGVVARHVAAGHFLIIGMARAIIKGEALPAMTMDQVIEMGNTHARDHADCTREEVQTLLKENGESAAAFVGQLSDDELDCKGHLDLFGGDVSVEQLIDYVIIQSGGGHLTSMKAAIA